MKGQYSIFDLNKSEKQKPCEYRFKRYIGQKVLFWLIGEVDTITKIEPYYTITAKGLVGTPTTICPAQEEP